LECGGLPPLSITGKMPAPPPSLLFAKRTNIKNIAFAGFFAFIRGSQFINSYITKIEISLRFAIGTFAYVKILSMKIFHSRRGIFYVIGTE